MLPEGERPLRVSDWPVRSSYRQLVISVPMPQIARQAVGHLWLPPQKPVDSFARQD